MPGRSFLLPFGLPASGLTEGRSAGFALLPGRLSPGRLPGRVTLIGLSRSSDLNPPLSDGLVPAEGLVWADGFTAVEGRVPADGFVAVEGLVAGLSTVVLGLRSEVEPVDGRVAVPAGLPEVEGFTLVAGFDPVEGFTV